MLKANEGEFADKDDENVHEDCHHAGHDNGDD